jgi:hypothetical protein
MSAISPKRVPDHDRYRPDGAVEAGIETLIATFKAVRDCKGYAPQKQADLADRMIETLKAYLSQSRQLSLF